MKKRLFHIGIIGVLALAACSRTEDVLPAGVEDYIRFGMPGMEVEAKSTLVNGTLPEGSQFGVLGYCLAQVAPDNPELNASSGSVSWDTKKELCRPHLFYKKTVTYSGGACTYADPVPLNPQITNTPSLRIIRMGTAITARILISRWKAGRGIWVPRS